MENNVGIADYDKLFSTLSELLSVEDDFISLAVLGSVARQQASKNSDIDVIVVYRGSRENMYKKWRTVKSMVRDSSERKKLKEKGLSAYISPVFLSEVGLKENIMLLDVIDDGVILFDKANVLQKSLDAMRDRLKELGSKKVFLNNGRLYWDLKPDWKIGERFKI